MHGFRMTVKSVLQSYRWYWKLCANYRNGAFKFLNLIYKARKRFLEWRLNTKVLKALLSATVTSLILAGLVCLTFIVVSLAIETAASDNPRFGLDNFLSIISQVSETNKDSYDQILIAIVTVVGIFLTLYFTNLGTIAETLFSKLPKGVRDLYIKERVGNVYTNFLITLLLMSLVFLFIGVVLDFRYKVILLVIGISSLFAIQAFVILGKRAFHLFDPTPLAVVLREQFLQLSENSSSEGFLWQNPAFQRHYQRLADKTLEGLNSLVTISVEDKNLKWEALPSIIENVSALLKDYLGNKRHIPSNSLWFIQKPDYPNWYLSDAHKVLIATSTQTDIQPLMKPDSQWVEEKLITKILEVVKISQSSNNWQLLIKLLNRLSWIFECFGQAWEIPFGKDVLKRIQEVVNEYVSNADLSNRASSSTPLSERLAVIDHFGILPISLLVSFVNSLDNLHAVSLAKNIEKLKWDQPKSLYELNLPSPVLERAELIQQRLLFEKKVEKRIVTAKWYIKQLVFQALANSYKTQLEELLDIGEDICLLAETWLSMERLTFVAELIRRGLEFFNKLKFHISKFEEAYSRLEEFNIENSIPWPEIDWVEKKETILQCEKRLCLSYSNCIPGLLPLRRMKDIPDSFGRIVHITGEQCFKALVANDLESFGILFPNYFLGIMRVAENVSIETENMETEFSVLASSGPILDLCELSGYSYFFSEYHSNHDLWNVCRSTWDNYLKERTAKRLSFLALLISYNSKSIVTTPRGLVITNWRRLVDEILRNMERVPVQSDIPSFIPHFPKEIDHPSTLIRVMGGRRENSFFTSYYDGLDIFVSLYLQKVSEDELDFGNTRDLWHVIERHNAPSNSD